jgi:hypothetical protein
VGKNASIEQRHLAWARVEKRLGHSLELTAEGVNLPALKKACKDPETAAAAHPWIAGCQIVSDSPLQFMRESTAMRFPAWVMAGLLIALIFLLGTQWFGPWAGLFAALAYLFVPRQFFHAHLCTFDTAVTTMIVATIYAFWRSLESRRWAIACSVIWGLALLTKLNAFFIPLPLLAWWLLTSPPKLYRNRSNGSQKKSAVIAAVGILATASAFFLLGMPAALCTGLIWGIVTGIRIQLKSIPAAFLWMPPVGLTMLFVMWPLLWYDTAQSFTQYVSFHLNHVHYLQMYFGQILAVPPFPVSYPFVITALTVPLVLLVLFGVGAVTIFVTHRQEVELRIRWMVALNLAFGVTLIALPETPIFGGIKHWLSSMVFFAIIAGYGFDWLRKQFLARLPQPAALQALCSLLLAGLLLSSSVADSLQYRLFGTAYYNEIAGGVRGASENGMHRQFWGYASRYALDFVNEHAASGSHVAFHNTTWDAMAWYQRDGLLRQDLRWRRDPSVFCRKGNYYLFHHQKSFAQDQLNAWEHMNSQVPDDIISVDGVPMLSIYSCKGRDRR